MRLNFAEQLLQQFVFGVLVDFVEVDDIPFAVDLFEAYRTYDHAEGVLLGLEGGDDDGVIALFGRLAKRQEVGVFEFVEAGFAGEILEDYPGVVGGTRRYVAGGVVQAAAFGFVEEGFDDTVGGQAGEALGAAAPAAAAGSEQHDYEQGENCRKFADIFLHLIFILSHISFI